LPSIRRLAIEYEISPQTVQNALRELREEQLVVAQQGRAFFVRDPGRPLPGVSEPEAERLAAVEAELRSLTDRVTAVEEDNEALRALIMDLRGRIEQPGREVPEGAARREQAG
jgi:DNA-binding transcriptional regulator YhcF (GntR family)